MKEKVNNYVNEYKIVSIYSLKRYEDKNSDHNWIIKLNKTKYKNIGNIFVCVFKIYRNSVSHCDVYNSLSFNYFGIQFLYQYPSSTKVIFSKIIPIEFYLLFICADMLSI